MSIIQFRFTPPAKAMNWSLTSTAIYIICRQPAALLHSLRFLGRLTWLTSNLSKQFLKASPLMFTTTARWSVTTYIDDVIEGWCGWCISPEAKSSVAATSIAPHKIYNIGNNSPVDDVYWGAWTGSKQNSPKEPYPMQPGDVPCTYADVDDLIKDVGFKFSTPIDEGHFVNWYREYYKK